MTSQLILLLLLKQPFLIKRTLLFIKNKTMKKTVFILGYISLVVISTGFLFKLQHWPGANVMTATGILFLNFIYLPLLFIDKYRTSKA